MRSGFLQLLLTGRGGLPDDLHERHFGLLLEVERHKMLSPRWATTMDATLL